MSEINLSFLEKKPSIDSSVFIGTGASITGDVTIGENSSIWYNSVLRADVEKIQIGNRTNIQDLSVIHVDHDKPCVIGNDVTIGHSVNLHGCVIEDSCLIGIGAIILSGAVIKKGSIIAAGSVIKENQIVEPYSLMAGVPARFIRQEKNFLEKNINHAKAYIEIANKHKLKNL
ncbi:MAG: hypothetical protein ACD_79C01035G0005 [uncultured bacterium]|nr:MAG: hypothetical protein ACD_79C01035G0005 [uncultured bacterium]